MPGKSIYDGRDWFTIPEVIARFRSKHTTGDGCWEWTGSLDHNGYGQFAVNGRMRIASRASWIIEHQHEPTREQFVCHTCDNSLCVRPDHLYLGDRLTNGRDSAVRGTSARGEGNGTAKLREMQVVLMRELYHAGHCNTRDLSVLTSLDQKHIAEIVVGKKWKYAGGPTGVIPRVPRRLKTLEGHLEQVA
jgi:hypothetical protein